jgi:SSS family solute:Na+ symporter
LGKVALLLYIAVIIGLGYWAKRKTRNVGDFFLGGRTIGPWLSAFAYGTTYFSAVLFIGYGGKLGWGYGLHTMWIVLGNTIIGTMLAWWVLGKRTREMTAKLNAMTMPAFLAERFNKPALKVVAATLIFIFLVPYSASVYKGLSFLFQEALVLTETQALWLMAVLTGVYLVLGGYFAIALTDFLMGLMMLFGVVVMVGDLTGSAGGIVHATKLLADTKTCSPMMNATLPGGIPGWMFLASLVVVTSLGPWGMPQMVQKFYSIKSGDQVKRAMIVATLFALVISFGAYYTGALTHLNVPEKAAAAGSVRTPPISDFLPSTALSDQKETDWNPAFVVGVLAAPSETSTVSAIGDYTSPTELPVRTGPDGNAVIGPNGEPVIDWDRWMPIFLAHRLPSWIMLIIVLLVLSASMSTLSSLVLVSSSAIAIDLYAGEVNANADKKGVLVLMRVLCAVFVMLSLWMAMTSPAYIITLMVISWGLLAGAFAAPYLYGLFWRRTTTAGVVAGMIAGVGSAIVLSWVLGDPGITPADPGVPVAGAIAIILPFLVVPLVSLITKPLPEKVISHAFGPVEQ